MPRPSAKTSRRRARSATVRRSRSRARPSGSRRSSATRSSRTARSRCSITRGMRTAGSGWIAGAITASGCRSTRSCCSARTRGWGAIRGGRFAVPYAPLDRRAAALDSPRRAARSGVDAAGRAVGRETLLEILGRLAPSAEPRRTGATPGTIAWSRSAFGSSCRAGRSSRGRSRRSRRSWACRHFTRAGSSGGGRGTRSTGI